MRFMSVAALQCANKLRKSASRFLICKQSWWPEQNLTAFDTIKIGQLIAEAGRWNKTKALMLWLKYWLRVRRGTLQAG